MTQSVPTLDDIQTSASIFRRSNSALAMRDILNRVCGKELYVVADVPAEHRAAVIAAFEGRATVSAKNAFVKDGVLDHISIMARFNNPASRSSVTRED